MRVKRVSIEFEDGSIQVLPGSGTPSPEDMEDLVLRGGLVHVFAGYQGPLVEREDGETFSQLVARAAKLSKDGSVWLTPHWC